MKHVFLLYVFLGIGEDTRLVSNDMYFADLNDCVWYAQTIHKQGKKVTSYCLPTLIDKNMKVY
jgi:hypothetical protein